MKKVMQTKTGLGGNCQSATIATLLEMDINDIPDFWEGCDKSKPDCPINGQIYNDNFDRFLETIGFISISLGTNGEDNSKWITEISKKLHDTKLLVNGISPRGYMHSVIWMNGKLWHDPHPEGGGVVPANITFIMPKFIGKNLGDEE